MPLLTGPEIARRVGTGELVIEPFDPENVNPNSYNLRLGAQLLIYSKQLRLQQAYEDREHWIDDIRTGRMYHPRPDPYPHGCLGLYQEPLDMAVEELTMPLAIPKEGRVLFPGVLYLGSTLEYTETRDLAPKIDGRSSVGRLGKMIHITAGFGDDGFCGDWTLEILVAAPLRVYPGVPVCQIAYSTLEGAREPYKGRYQGQRGPKASGLWKTIKKYITGG